MVIFVKWWPFTSVHNCNNCMHMHYVIYIRNMFLAEVLIQLGHSCESAPYCCFIKGFNRYTLFHGLMYRWRQKLVETKLYGMQNVHFESVENAMWECHKFVFWRLSKSCFWKTSCLSEILIGQQMLTSESKS